MIIDLLLFKINTKNKEGKHMKSSEVDIDLVYEMGKKAFHEQCELDVCPYRPDSISESVWIQGWQEQYFADPTWTQNLEEDLDSVDKFYLRYSWLAEHDPLEEAVYQGRTVPLRKVMKGDTRRNKVYVNSGRKDSQGRIIAKKVEFGSEPGAKLRLRKNDPARRRSFAARHRCHTANDPKTARYWSCRAPQSKVGGVW